MSETPVIRLELLGEMIRRLQADLRTVRDEGKMRDKLMELHTERIVLHETVTQSRLDQLAEITFAIADKLGVDYRR